MEPPCDPQGQQTMVEGLIIPQARVVEILESALLKTLTWLCAEKSNYDQKAHNEGRELQDKQERLQRIELVLQEPMTTQSELERLTNEVKKYQRECQLLDDKIRQNAPADDKLAIYKS